MSECPSPQPADSENKSVIGANFWIRALAHGIDFSILMLISCLISIPLLIRMVSQGLAAAGSVDPSAMSYPLWVDIAYQLVIAVVVITLWRKTQTTPGKALFQLRIVNLSDGGRPSLTWLVVRFVGYLIAMVPIPLPLIAMAFPGLKEIPHFGILFEDWRMLLPLMLGYLWIFIDPRNCGWHDLMSGTVTIQKPRVVKSTPPPIP